MPDMQDIIVTVSVPISVPVPEGVSFEDIAAGIMQDNWNEGRYPFEVEMLHEGLRRMVQRAIYDSLSRHLNTKYGGEMLPTYDAKGRENGCTNRAAMETSETMRDVKAYVRDGIRSAEVRSDETQPRAE